MYKFRKSMIYVMLFVVIAIFLVACGGGGDTGAGGTGYSLSSTPPVDTSTPSTSTQQDAPIDGLQCQPDMSPVFHIHIRLFIWISGQLVQMPQTVGHGQSECLYWIHTHDFDASYNIIHIEAPQEFTPNLQMVLDVWKQAVPDMYSSELNQPGWYVWYNGQQLSGGTFQGDTFGEHDVIVMAYNTTNVPIGTPDDYPWTIQLADGQEETL